MTPEKWQKIKNLFEAAKDVSPGKRTKFLKNACGDDKDLKAEIEKLLASSNEVDSSFLKDPAAKEVASQILEQETSAFGNTAGKASIANFVAGTVLDNRYRILGLLGKGGMGEVYKAEDLELDQVVALKFLPAKLADNENLLKRFRGEVRTARKVSHENVCRVFDIGEINGRRFLSMEFIEGDDLSQLLNRIGRLPSDKAIEISCQICLGLNAIHKLGILHRDLKPANIIIDANGLARITDFGIAGFEQDVQGSESRVGTPAYMSPEQITGKEVTQQSDIYSLGLLIYEIFTGKQAVVGDSVEELSRKHQTTSPTTVSEIIETVDPLVEKTINRCLEKDPKDRPDSAVQVALALPGGNPLEVALEAGETPSPEMIAAAPVKGALKPLVALGLLIGFIGSFSLLMYWMSIYGTSSYVPLEDSSEVLAKKAQTIISDLGYTEPPIDKHYRFRYDGSYREFVNEQMNPKEAWEKVRNGQPIVYYFRYRQSPKYLTPSNYIDSIGENNPPLTEPGMINVDLDTKGRLIKFTAVPTLKLEKTESPNKNDWKKLFDEAGLDIDKFREVEAKQRPSVFADEIIGWTGTMAEYPEIPIRIEAAGYQGKPVYFNIITTWKESGSVVQQRIGESSARNVLQVVFFSLVFLTLFASFWLARYNLKKGRGDLKGALKIAVVFFVLLFIRSLLTFYGDTSVPTAGNKVGLFFELAAHVGLNAFFLFVAYLAIEPFFRRRLSDLFISWNRLIMGDFRNPMIGRDILVGFFLSAGSFVIIKGVAILESTFNTRWIFDGFFHDSTNELNGLTSSLSVIPGGLAGATRMSFLFMFFILIFSFIFKKKGKSILAMAVLFGGIFVLQPILEQDWIGVLRIIIHFSCIVFIIFRFGLVGLIFLEFLESLINGGHITFDTTSFYFPSTVIMMVFVFSVAIYAFYISTGGQSFFGKGFLDDE